MRQVFTILRKMNNPLLSIDRVSAVLSGKVILEAISLNVNSGQHLAITGKSGSGKSILLKAIAGMQGLSGGSIAYGFNLYDSSNGIPQSPLKHIALIQSRHHFKNSANSAVLYYQQRYNSSDSENALTVEQYLASVQSRKTDGNWDLQKVVNRLRLKGLYDKQIIKLSNGETKRLRLAAALLKRPALLLLDEPLTGLDMNSRVDFNLLLNEISASGITVIIATSGQEIPDIIGRVVVLENGKLTQIIDRKDFNPENFLPEFTPTNINTAEIEALLSFQKRPAFDYIIKMAAVNVKYGEVVVLKNVSWRVKQGERWALLGPNGAGKSTLLSLVYGDNPQGYANNIILFDKKRGTGETIWDIKRQCGFVSPELFQYFPADNNCLQIIESGFYDTLGLFRISDPQRYALALRWMKILNIEQYAHYLLKNIPVSAQRLCLLARALVKNPALLILDEPCQGMDEQQVDLFKQIIDFICEKSNLTLIYVTHYRYEIPDAVDRYLRLDKGEVIK